jgi:hypothetical protein
MYPDIVTLFALLENGGGYLYLEFGDPGGEGPGGEGPYHGGGGPDYGGPDPGGEGPYSGVEAPDSGEEQEKSSRDKGKGKATTPEDYYEQPSRDKGKGRALTPEDDYQQPQSDLDDDDYNDDLRRAIEESLKESKIVESSKDTSAFGKENRSSLPDDCVEAFKERNRTLKEYNKANGYVVDKKMPPEETHY